MKLCVVSVITHNFKLELDQVRIEPGQMQIWVDLSSGHSCLGWIGSGMNMFGFHLVRVISNSGLHWVNKILGQLEFNLDHFGFRIKSGQYDFGWFSFGLVQIWVSD